VIVPPHVGQNTSQVANRISDYMRLYHPRLVIVMAGYNNQWSMAESHVVRFLSDSDATAWKVRMRIYLDNLRLFKVAHWFYLSLFEHCGANYKHETAIVALGHPELQRGAPLHVQKFARSHREAFRRSWNYDLELIIDGAR